jgi:hypothetical protein
MRMKPSLDHWRGALLNMLRARYHLRTRPKLLMMRCEHGTPLYSLCAACWYETYGERFEDCCCEHGISLDAYCKDCADYYRSWGA